MLWAILDFFFTDRTFFPPLTIPYKLKKNIFFFKNFFKVILFIIIYKSQNFPVIVSTMRVQGQKRTTGGRQTPPPTAC